MPELPEVETIRKQLSDLIVGLKIADIEILHPKSFIGDKKLALQRNIIGVRRFGKMLVIDLEGDYSLAVHLKMTGQILCQTTDNLPAQAGKEQITENREQNKHTRVITIFTNGDILFFNDIRKFGWIRIVRNETMKQFNNVTMKIASLKEILSKFGPEPLRDLTLGKFRKILKSSKKPVKLILMDQEKIAGVGNIYANDALFLSKIHPQKPADKVSEIESKVIFHKLLKVLKEGLKWKGASKTNFVDVFGRKGSMQEHFYVYGREGEMCVNQCGGKIERMTLGGRGTFYCRKCQQLI